MSKIIKTWTVYDDGCTIETIESQEEARNTLKEYLYDHVDYREMVDTEYESVDIGNNSYDASHVLDAVGDLESVASDMICEIVDDMPDIDTLGEIASSDIPGHYYSNWGLIVSGCFEHDGETYDITSPDDLENIQALEDDETITIECYGKDWDVTYNGDDWDVVKHVDKPTIYTINRIWVLAGIPITESMVCNAEMCDDMIAISIMHDWKIIGDIYKDAENVSVTLIREVA